MDRQDYILGLAILGHDTSLTVVNSDGDVVFIAEEERYSRKKRGQFVFHPDLVLEVLNEYRIDPRAVSTLAIAGDPSAWVANQQRTLSFSWEARARHLNAWMGAFQAALPCLEKTTFLRHHRAHAASAFFASPWDEAAVVTLDGFGDGEVATISHGCGSSLKLIESQPFPHSLPYMYHAFARWLGLDGHERDGKLMALAAYGSPSEEHRLRNVLSNGGTAAWRVAAGFLDVKCTSRSWSSTILNRLLGPARRPEDPIESRHCDAAASMQALLEAELLALFRRAKAHTGAANICCAGGAFLNCRANGVLLQSGIFESAFFQPLAADNGLSLGAALQAARESGRPPWRMRHARLGSYLDVDNLPGVVRNAGVRLSYTTDVVEATARLLAAGSIVGWCQGRLEAGPRSLCGRSLLADPRLHEMKDRLNQVKRRELWRPFAPVMLQEETPAMFGKTISSPYMNVAFQVIAPNTIPAAVHVDGTARLQTVVDEDDPLTARLLRSFRELTGVGVLVNTSLNVRGQPIARTVQDCVAFLCETKIDALVVGNFLVERTNKTRPVKLNCAPAWQKLPSEFVLATLDPDGSLQPWINDLHGRAAAIAEISVGPAFEVLASPAALQTIAGKKVVLLLPGYCEVWTQTLPRALAWALKIEPQCGELWLADLCGKVIVSRTVLVGLDKRSLAAQPLSDVELHYLRSAARRAPHSDNGAGNKEYSGSEIHVQAEKCH